MCRRYRGTEREGRREKEEKEDILFIFLLIFLLIFTAIVVGNFAEKEGGDGIYIANNDTELQLVVVNTTLTNSSPYVFCCGGQPQDHPNDAVCSMERERERGERERERRERREGGEDREERGRRGGS